MSILKGGVKLRYDSRDRHAHIRFGQTATFTDESNFGFDLYKVVEPESAVSCTAFSTTKVRASQTKVQYDVDDLWSKVPHGITGADPRDTLGTAIKLGLKDAIDIGRDYGIKGYYRADTGSLDAFDNARSAMTLNQSSLMINTYWYSEWGNTPIFGKMPVGKTKVSAHSYVIVDWKVIDGETVFLIDSHQGQKRYMPRETFNQALSEYGTSTLMPSIQSVLDERNKTVFEMIADVLKNAWILVSKIQIAINNLKAQPQPTANPVPIVDHYQEVKKTIMPKYQWDTKDQIIHSMRVIGDEFNLTVLQKDMLCDICGCESGYNPKAKLINSPTSIDRGLFQINNKYHPEATDALAYDPEWSTRWACGFIKRGINAWPASQHCWNKTGKYDPLS